MLAMELKKQIPDSAIVLKYLLGYYNSSDASTAQQIESLYTYFKDYHVARNPAFLIRFKNTISLPIYNEGLEDFLLWCVVAGFQLKRLEIPSLDLSQNSEFINHVSELIYSTVENDDLIKSGYTPNLIKSRIKDMIVLGATYDFFREN